MEQTKATPEQLASPAAEAKPGAAGQRRSAAAIRQAQRLASRACRRFPLLPVLGPAAFAALLAFALPVAAPDDRGASHNAAEFATSATARASEDLTTFRTSQRWGVSLQSERERMEAERAQAEQGTEAADGDGATAWSPELQAIGFVGVVVAATETVVLLTLPTDDVGRFHVGDLLQDGRRLASASAQALVLQQEDGDRETLPLFPPAAAAADAENLPTEGE